MISLNHLVKGHLIYEGLIHSVSVDRFVDLMSRWVISCDKFHIKPTDEKIVLHVKYQMTIPEWDNLFRFIHSLGWFVSAYLLSGDLGKWRKFDQSEFLKIAKDKLVLSMQIEAKYDLELDVDKFKILYHVSPSSNDAKIKNVGLVPKSGEKISAHPDRIYFAKSEAGLELITDKFHQLKKVNEFTYYTVDIQSAYKRDYNIRLFVDPNFENGIYTLSNIPPTFLSLLFRKTYD